MASLLAVVDPDPGRRRQFVERAAADLAPFAGLVSGGVQEGDFALRWAVSPVAPLRVASGAGAVGAVFGEALRRDGTRADVPAILRGERAFDGYHAAVARGPDGRVLALADVLGLFPIYAWSDGIVLLLGTSPEPFRHHPVFRPSLDPEALVGILLTNGLVGGPALWKGVRRLGAGRVLCWRPGSSLAEEPGYELPFDRVEEGPSVAAHAERLADALAAAVRRHVDPGLPHGLLLSGGLDSRILAGLLVEADRPPRAITWGQPHDLEVVCASRVAAALGIPHAAAEPALADPVATAERCARFEHLSAGFCGFQAWEPSELVRAAAPRTVSGLGMDLFVGPNFGLGVAGREDEEVSPDLLSIDVVLRSRLSWGFPMESLRDLLPVGTLSDALEVLLEEYRDAWAGSTLPPRRRAWEYVLRHRARYHVTSGLWPSSFLAWPVLPWLDRAVLEAALATPIADIDQRKVEQEILRRRFPRLASLPLDQNSYEPYPLVPRGLSGIGWGLVRRVSLLRRLRRRWLRRRGELRRYYRIYDVQGPVWSAVRAHAELRRGEAQRVFRAEAFDRLLPPPHVPLDVDDPIRGTAGPKALLGWSIWSQGRA